MQADRKKVMRKLNIAKGQLEGIIRMVEADRYCIDISTQLMAVIAALKAVNRDVLTAHLEHCVLNSLESANEEDKAEKISEVVKVIEKLSK